MTLCPHFGSCGGCVLQDLSADDYRAGKRAAVQSALMKAGVNAEVLDPVIVPPRTRRRAVFKIRSLPEGLHIGFHAARSHTVIDMHHCNVLTPALFALVGQLRTRLEPLFGAGEAAELHVTQTDTGFDAAFRWSRNLTPALTAELSTRLAGWHRPAHSGQGHRVRDRRPHRGDGRHSRGAAAPTLFCNPPRKANRHCRSGC